VIILQSFCIARSIIWPSVFSFENPSHSTLFLNGKISLSVKSVIELTCLAMVVVCLIVFTKILVQFFGLVLRSIRPRIEFKNPYFWNVDGDNLV